MSEPLVEGLINYDLVGSFGGRPDARLQGKLESFFVAESGLALPTHGAQPSLASRFRSFMSAPDAADTPSHEIDTQAIPDFSASIGAAVDVAPMAKMGGDDTLLGDKEIEDDLEELSEYRAFDDDDVIPFEIPPLGPNTIVVNNPRDFVHLFHQSWAFIRPYLRLDRDDSFLYKELAHELAHFESYRNSSHARSLEANILFCVSFHQYVDEDLGLQFSVLPELCLPSEMTKADLARGFLAPMDDCLDYDLAMVEALGYRGTPKEILRYLDGV